MLKFIENMGNVPVPGGSAVLALDFGQRSRTRQRANLDDGREAGILLAHGRGLREGDVLRAADGTTAVVRCRSEEVATARAGDWLSLARAAYHLGNRHAALQLGELWLRFQPDPVLLGIVASLGLAVTRETAPFDPEPGVGSHPRGGGHSHSRAEG